MRNVYELVDEAIEELGVEGLADYLVMNFPTYAEKLSDKINALIILDEISKKEEV